jgi:FkbM family methyltransferase
MGLLNRLARTRDAVRQRLKGHPRQSVQLELPLEVMGSEYGGYAVCPTGLDQQSVVYSFGVGEDVSFDLAMIERFGVTVHAFDPTPRSIEWVRGQQLPDRFRLHEYGLADRDTTVQFAPPENPDHISHTLLERKRASGKPIEVPVRCLRTITRELGHDRVDVLKMDIEGAEYGVIDDLIGSPLPISQILLEFHHHLEGVPLRTTERAIAKLNDAGYRIFHASGTGREFSFIRQ